jgi:hypothetical protein
MESRRHSHHHGYKTFAFTVNKENLEQFMASCMAAWRDHSEWNEAEITMFRETGQLSVTALTRS